MAVIDRVVRAERLADALAARTVSAVSIAAASRSRLAATSSRRCLSASPKALSASFRALAASRRNWSALPELDTLLLSTLSYSQ
ncbi:PSK operon transcription factor [Sphingomonas sp. C8-2]|nr:PSK operon transcription factor [Sphingomonas sp. C8-2]